MSTLEELDKILIDTPFKKHGFGSVYIYQINQLTDTEGDGVKLLSKKSAELMDEWSANNGATWEINPHHPNIHLRLPDSEIRRLDYASRAEMKKGWKLDCESTTIDCRERFGVDLFNQTLERCANNPFLAERFLEIQSKGGGRIPAKEVLSYRFVGKSALKRMRENGVAEI